MNPYLNASKENEFKEFIALRERIEKKKQLDIQHRIAKNPSPTNQESILGAFIEMYDPHLRPLIYSLYDKGYTIDASSGFTGKYHECQMLNGSIIIEDKIVNRLAKIGVKVQMYNSRKSMKFWPEAADMDRIMDTYLRICDILPVRTEPPEAAQTIEAANFRRKYVPTDTNLQRQRLFEILMYQVREVRSADTKKRLIENPEPDALETKLGAFREMLEPQVLDAVIELNSKGYTTDISGFLGTAEVQAIEGDFSIDESVQKKLQSLDVTVITNPSGYTRIEYRPEEADIKAMKNKWKKIASLFPDTGKKSDPSMTLHARDFRKKY